LCILDVLSPKFASWGILQTHCSSSKACYRNSKVDAEELLQYKRGDSSANNNNKDDDIFTQGLKLGRQLEEEIENDDEC
jgi:hypothetical protein